MISETASPRVVSSHWRIEPHDDSALADDERESLLSFRQCAMQPGAPLQALQALDLTDLPRMRDAAPDRPDAELADFQRLGPQLQSIVLSYLGLGEGLSLLTPALQLRVRSEHRFARVVAALEACELVAERREAERRQRLGTIHFLDLPSMRESAPHAPDPRLAAFQELGPDVQAIVLNFLGMRQRLTMLSPAMQLQVRSQPRFARVIAALQAFDLGLEQLERAQVVRRERFVAAERADPDLGRCIGAACMAIMSAGLVGAGSWMLDLRAGTAVSLTGAGVASAGSVGLFVVGHFLNRHRIFRSLNELVSRQDDVVKGLQRELREAKAEVEAAILSQSLHSEPEGAVRMVVRDAIDR